MLGSSLADDSRPTFFLAQYLLNCSDGKHWAALWDRIRTESHVDGFLSTSPRGRGHDHLGEGFVGAVFQGREIAGITTFSDGLPYHIFTPVDSSAPKSAAHPSKILMLLNK